MKDLIVKSTLALILGFGLIAFAAYQPDLNPSLSQNAPSQAEAFAPGGHAIFLTANSEAREVLLINDAAPAPIVGADSIQVGGISLGAIVTLLGAVIIIARFIVKITPTPKDDGVLDKIIGFLKHLGLVIEK